MTVRSLIHANWLPLKCSWMHSVLRDTNGADCLYFCCWPIPCTRRVLMIRATREITNLGVRCEVWRICHIRWENQRMEYSMSVFNIHNVELVLLPEVWGVLRPCPWAIKPWGCPRAHCRIFAIGGLKTTVLSNHKAAWRPFQVTSTYTSSVHTHLSPHRRSPVIRHPVLRFPHGKEPVWIFMLRRMRGSRGFGPPQPLKAIQELYFPLHCCHPTAIGIRSRWRWRWSHIDCLAVRSWRGSVWRFKGPSRAVVPTATSMA